MYRNQLILRWISDLVAKNLMRVAEVLKINKKDLAVDLISSYYFEVLILSIDLLNCRLQDCYSIPRGVYVHHFF